MNDAPLTDPGDLTALVNDLYQLTMAASFYEAGVDRPACFTMAVRKIPPRRGFMVAAGLERLLQIAENFHFATPVVDYLASLKIFRDDFLSFLGKLRFNGEIWALPEGSIFFAEEPIVEVRAPIIQAQLLETIALNQVGAASMLATKAARCFAAAEGRRLIDFGLRRSHGLDAAMIAARSSYIAGFHGTSNLLAGYRYGIPVFGTMAHSYVMAHEHERDAFDNFVRLFPRLSTLLVDTYDPVRALENAAAVAKRLKQSGASLQGIRLDSGDLLDLSRRARRILDRDGLKDVAIFASGNLDEYLIRELLHAGAPIDAFGVGTAMVTSADAPSLDINYKLAEYNGSPRIKTSTGKASLPGTKQLFRAFNSQGVFYADLIGLAEESAATVARELRPAAHEIKEMLKLQMRGGARTGAIQSIGQVRERFLDSFARLEPRYKLVERPEPYPVRLSSAMNAMIISERLKAERRQD